MIEDAHAHVARSSRDSRSAAAGAVVPRAERASPASRRRRGAAVHAALASRPAAAPRIAPTARRARTTKRPSPPRRSLAVDEVLGAARAGARDRRDALLHGRGLARGEGRSGVRPRARRWCAACARSAWRRASRSACSTTIRRAGSKRPGLTAYNHNLDTSRQHYKSHHHDAHLRRSPDDARSRARRPASPCARAASSAWASRSTIAARCCARSRRSIRSRRACRSIRWSPTEGTPLASHAAGRSARAGAHDRDRAHPDAAVARAAVGGAAVAVAEAQLLCFFAGANSIFYGEKLLTTGNPDVSADQALLAAAGLRAAPIEVDAS